MTLDGQRSRIRDSRYELRPSVRVGFATQSGQSAMAKVSGDTMRSVACARARARAKERETAVLNYSENSRRSEG